MSILDSVLAALGGGTIGVIATAAAKRGASRDASATAVVAPLLKRVESLEKDRDADRVELKTAHESYMNAMQAMRDGMEERAKADRKACDEEITRRIAEVRADLGYVAARVSQSGDDDTGLHRIVRRSPTPPEPMAAQPEERRGELMPRKPATEVPPPRGSKETR